MLGNLSTMLDKATKHAENNKFDVTVLLNSRLAPDQFHFIRQVQIACDTAKGFAARMTGQEPPKHEDKEQTLDELRQRIHKTVQYLQTFKADMFQGSEKRPIKMTFMEGKALPGFEFANEMALPNLYFHMTTTYAILRHNGVDEGRTSQGGELSPSYPSEGRTSQGGELSPSYPSVGKMDFLGNLKFQAM
jgi:hypothetical protein